MSKVQVLPEEIVAKIAAGEVIDRPASVIKELMENSIDAGSTHIELTLKDAGKALIIIKDDGHGIAQDDLETIFQRHATSKIHTIEDLFEIHSLGFRGEALYSVAAISDVIVRSRTTDQAEGWEIHTRGGKTQDVKPCAFNERGTHIEIRELFFNTPARKKFLKTNASEFHQVLNIFTPYTLLYPNISFKLTHQGRDILDLSATDKLEERIADVLNLNVEHLLSAQEHFPEQNLKIRMIMGDINIKRTRRDMQFCFVNSRPVFNKNISYHLNQIYRLIMPPEQFPFFCVYLELPADDVDVNIHPTKKEVKIRNEREICTLLRRLSEQTLMSTGKVKRVAPQEPFKSHVRQSLNYNSAATSFDQKGADTVFEPKPSFSGEAANKDYAYPRTQSNSPSVKESPREFYIPENQAYQDDSLQSKLEKSRYIGSFIHKFLFYESGTNLLIVDQHAAAERVTYEKLIRQMEKGNVEVQPLLSPILVSVSPQELTIYEEIQEDFGKLGLESSLFDPTTLAIHSQPVLLKDVETTVRHLLAGEKITTRDHDQIARRACRSSIMSGDKLSVEQCEFLKEELLQCLDPLTCPHGRPTVIEMTEDFLDKQFLRT